MRKIVFLEPLGLPTEALDRTIRAALGQSAELVYYPDRPAEEAELLRRCEGAEAVVLSNLPLGGSVIECCPELKLICVAFTGVDHIDVDCCRARGVAVCNCAGYATAAVADLTFALTLALKRNVLNCDGRCRAGGAKDGLVGTELEGQTFGVVGAGAIGSRVAAIAAAFGCRVLAYNHSPKTLPGVEFVTLPELLRRSDIVSLHVPLNASTRGLIGAEEFALMKPSALLINTARGGVVDTAALCAALEQGTIAGAGIDVFDGEPPLDVDAPLLHAPNLLCTPHVGFATRQAFEKRAVLVGQNLAAYLAGEMLNRIC